MTEKTIMKCEDLIGTAVVSLTGRDHKRTMIIVGMEIEQGCLTGRVLIADGRLRRIEKPKLKKLMHVRPIQGFAAEAAEKEAIISQTATNKMLWAMTTRADALRTVNAKPVQCPDEKN